MPRTLVTGATGFIGRNLVERLRGQGDHVRCLVRKTANPAALAALTALGAELVQGDVTDPASLPAAVQDIEVVFHVAGESEFTPRNVQSPDERRHQVFAIKVRVEAPAGMFKPGMAAEVFLPTSEGER